MLILSFYYYKKITAATDYLGGARKMRAAAGIISVQVSAAAVPLFIFLPEAAEKNNGLLSGIIISCAVITGIAASYMLMSERLRVYTEISNDSRTLPSYLSSRFSDASGGLRAFSAAIITVFMLLLAAYAMSSAAELAAKCFKSNSISVLLIIGMATAVYLYLGGIPSSVRSDSYRSLLIFASLLAVLIYTLLSFFGDRTDSAFSALNDLPETIKGQSVTFTEIISYAGIALGFFGMPTVIKKYIITKERKPPKRIVLLPVLWCAVCACGLLLICFLAGKQTSLSEALTDYLENMREIREPEKQLFPDFLEAFTFVGYLSALIAVADSSLLAAASAFSNDIYAVSINSGCDAKHLLKINRLTVIAATVAAFLLAAGNNRVSVMEPALIWAVMGASFGPVLLFSLYCRRLTVSGAVCSVASGLLGVLIWKFIFSSFGGLFAVYELIPAFLFSTAVLYAVSYADRQKPSARVLNEYGRMHEIMKMR